MNDIQTTSDITEGADVYGSDGEKVGTIVEIRPNYAVVEKGFFFRTDYYIPISAFSGVRDSKLYLTVTRDAALNQGWDARPDDDVAEGGTTAAAAHHPTVTTDPALDVLVNAQDAAPTETGAAPEGELLSGAPIALPVARQPARVARREVGQPVGPAEMVLEEELIDIPLYGEAVRAQTRLRVAEEVEITKEAVQRTAQVTGTVRHEEVQVVGHVVEIDRGDADAAWGGRGERR